MRVDKHKPWCAKSLVGDYEDVACGCDFTCRPDITVATVISKPPSYKERAEAAEAKVKRMGLKLERLGLHLHETRAKLRKVEGELEALREAMRGR